MRAVGAQAKGSPLHLSKSIEEAVAAAQAHSARAFQLKQTAKHGEAVQEASLDEAARRVASTAVLGAIEELKPRKKADAPSRTGGYQQRHPKLVPFGGNVSYADSVAKLELGPAPALDLALTRTLRPPHPPASVPAPAPVAAPVAEPAPSSDLALPTGGTPAADDDEALRSKSVRSKPPQPRPLVIKSPPPAASPLDMPTLLPPRRAV